MKETVNGLIKAQIPLTWLLGILFAALVWGLTLTSTVQAMQEKGVLLRKDMETEVARSADSDGQLLDKVNKLDRNQAVIMHSMGLTPVK